MRNAMHNAMTAMPLGDWIALAVALAVIAVVAMGVRGRR
jgi:hypothetical protein